MKFFGKLTTALLSLTIIASFSSDNSSASQIKDNQSNKILVTQANISQLKGLSDVPSPNKEMIEDLSKLGIFGDAGEEVNLLEPISRAEYLTWLFKANNAIRPPEEHIRLAPTFNPGFTDINSSHPAYKYVQAFANTGYSVGYEDKTFRPDTPITREEMIGIKVALDAQSRSNLDHNVWGFSDFEQIDSRFIFYVNQDDSISGEYGSNIERAFGNLNTFKPQESVISYEAAASLWQFGGRGSYPRYNALHPGEPQRHSPVRKSTKIE